jgi:hypothetical protein
MAATAPPVATATLIPTIKSRVKQAARPPCRFSAHGNAPPRGQKVWTYTHAWRAVARASWGDAVSVLASVETVRATWEAMAKAYATTVVVAAFEREGAYRIDGVTVVPCPQQTRGVT